MPRERRADRGAFPNIPDVVVAASGALLKSRPEVAERFVGLFHQATEWIRTTIAKALVSPAVSFVSNPARIRQATEALLAYQMELGDFPQAPVLDG